MTQIKILSIMSCNKLNDLRKMYMLMNYHNGVLSCVLRKYHIYEILSHTY